ncbi:hypothetical protein [Paraglaciecola sp. L1A13]|uniref:hypothetical protein n=1 Tax=Paraglaciecola sp. L1A13 TaxID=2686359 RepID=UPI00131BF9AD|nr:hypothetical protein [Paraglaciecola sp. L1A13]
MAYYLSAFIDPGNSGGSVVIPEFMEGISSEPARYYCQVCEASFATRQDLILHVWQQHPTKQPQLYINNRELRSTRFICRDKTLLGTLIGANYQTIRVNGEETEIEAFNSTMKFSDNQFYVIELINSKVTRKFELDVKLAASDEINAIDKCFMSFFNGRGFTSETLDNFIQSVKEYKSAVEYVEGIVCYLQGILAKDGRTSYINYEDHEAKLNVSLEKLSSFNSQLAEVICNIIYFIKNDLNSITFSGLMPSIESVTVFLLRHEKVDILRGVGQGNFDLPIDRITEHTVRLITEKYPEHESAQSFLKEVDALLRSGDLTREEKEKLNLVVYQKAMQCGDVDLQSAFAKKIKRSEWAI